ncbi:DUF6953 family protein [Paenibacillus dauci]|uniref:DUF6953 family protein n=1 Tax=Paenibacillus dauci TaxID=1567106 RepID=UPI000619415E|nr:hypothetical protein [Paenibacillus dauci]
MEPTVTTEQQIAEWMVNQIREQGVLKQEDAIAHVRAQYGEQYLFTSESGNISLDKEIKKAFRKSHGGRVAWDRDGFFWAWT